MNDEISSKWQPCPNPLHTKVLFKRLFVGFQLSASGTWGRMEKDPQGNPKGRTTYLSVDYVQYFVGNTNTLFIVLGPFAFYAAILRPK